MITLKMKTRVMSSDIFSVSLKEAQLGVIEDVEVSTTQAVARSTE